MKPNVNGVSQSGLPSKFWILALIAFVNSVSFTIIIPVLYPYARQFGLSDFQASLLTTCYAVSQFIATPILGRISDAVGRKPLLVISLFGTFAANLIASFTSVVWLLFAARILDGLTGGNVSIARAVVSDITHPLQRPKAFGFFDAAFRLGFIAGPGISFFAQQIPPLPGVSPLGMSFFAAAAIASIATVLAAVLLSETLAEKEELVLSWSIFGLGRIWQSLDRTQLRPAFFLTFFNGLTFTIFTFAFQPFFLNVLQQDTQTLALMFILVGLVGVATQLFAVERLTNRFNLADILASAIGLRGLVFLLIPTFPHIPIFIALLCLLGMANAFPLPLISSILSTNSSEREQGQIQGINASYLSISNAIGPAIGGLLASISYSTPFWLTGVLTLITARFALRLRSLTSS